MVNSFGHLSCGGFVVEPLLSATFLRPNSQCDKPGKFVQNISRILDAAANCGCGDDCQTQAVQIHLVQRS